MAETVHLYLKANGSDIKGESTQESLGRKDSIECISYEQGVTTAREATTGMVTGRRQYTPLTIRKRLDKASPLITKALVENQKIDAVFKFFRPNPAGDGTTEQFFTVEIKNGHVSAIRQQLPNTITAGTSGEPPQEEVSFVFKDITWTYTNGGITHSDSWSSGK
jgi:type VI secretion system secreted protein Hcp